MNKNVPEMLINVFEIRVKEQGERNPQCRELMEDMLKTIKILNEEINKGSINNGEKS